MYILKNAWISITRNKGRNILMGIIILVIACATTISLAIISASNKLLSSYQEKYDITATIGMNRESMMKNFDPSNEQSKEEMKENFNSLDSITVEDIKNYADSNYVKSYYYKNSIGMNANIEAASSENKGPERKEESKTDFTITGYSSYDAMNEFLEGTYQITDGSVDSDFESNTCIINSELATMNNLKVGDTIILKNPNNETKTYELKITGLFKDNENNRNMFSNSVNTIITNTTVIENILENNTDLTGNLNPTFVLTSKDVIDRYKQELTEKGLNEMYSLNTNIDQIENETESIQNVSNFAKTFLIITLLVGGVVLFILNFINVRERRYEIGVLRTIGMKKQTVIIQFVTELLIVSIISLILGGVLGSIVSVPTANNLLKSEIESSNQQQEQIENNFGNFKKGDKTSMSGVSKIEYIDEIDAVVSPKILLELIGIGLSLTLISSLAAMIHIAKFSPLTILKERS